MSFKVSAELAFVRALRSFQTGGIAFTSFISEIRAQLAEGAPANALLEQLWRSENIEALPPYARDAVVTMLRESPSNRPTPVERPIDPTAERPVAPAPHAQSTTLWTPPDKPAPPSAPTPAAVEPSDAITVDLDEVKTGASSAGPRVAAAVPGFSVGDTVLGRLLLLELVGEGGMSTVYKATPTPLADGDASQQFIAVKVLTRSVLNSDAFADMQAQVERLSRLNHPNIVRMRTCERDGSTVFMTMEFLAGDSLFKKLRAGDGATPSALDREEARSLMGGVAGALEYAHQNGIVHGDLKPANVMTSGGVIKVIDFGLTTWLGVTPRYASPQLMARQKPAAADDVYALACLAYELISGRHPFDDGTGELNSRFPPAQRPEFSPSEYSALVHALQLDPHDRTSSVSQFMQEFTAPARRRMAATRGIWVGVAGILIALAIGWFYSHPLRQPMPSLPAVPATATTPAPAMTAGGPSGAALRDCPTCPLMTILPRGQFKQGSPKDLPLASPLEQPQHDVVIGYPLAMSTNDITVGEFREFATATQRNMQGCDTYDGQWGHHDRANWSEPGFAQTALHPVTCVSWDDAVAYAQWLSARTTHRYRLPSASEWEYAARAGDTAAHPWDAGKISACAAANVADRTSAREYPGWRIFDCDDGFAQTAPVGSFPANAFGMNDMLGNVIQWTQDCWHADYVGAPRDGAARADGDCAKRELRGSSWFSSPSFVKASYRNHFASDYRASSIGFRLVRELTP